MGKLTPNRAERALETAVGALDQGDVEDKLHAATRPFVSVGADGPRPCWATIRSGLGAGLQEGADLKTA